MRQQESLLQKKPGRSTFRTRVRRGIARALAVATMSTAAGLTMAGTALAVPAITYVESTSPYNSASPKKIVAQCPLNQRVLGGAAYITGSAGQVLIQGAFPTFDAVLNRYVFVVKAAEDQTGTALGWGITAGAYCTDLVPTYPAAVSSAFNSDPVKSTPPVACPEGLKVVGMGGQVSTSDGPPANTLADIPSGNVVFKGFETDAGLNNVTARATEQNGLFGGTFAGSWKVSAVAVCANPLYFPGLDQLSQEETAGSSEAGNRMDHGCGSSSKQAIAFGSKIEDGDSGWWYLDRFSRYNEYKKWATVYETYRNEELGTALVYHTGYSICIDG